MVNKLRIRKGDNVIVIAGKDKGKVGVVLNVETEAQRLVISGVNMLKKHVKPNPQLQREGGIVAKEASVHISNVMIVNPKTQKRDRVVFKLLGEENNKKKVRCFASDGEVIDV